jgi:hypothetical protein
MPLDGILQGLLREDLKPGCNAVQLWHWNHTYPSNPVVSEAHGNGVEGSGMI